METELQMFYCNQIDPEYAYNKLVGLDDIFRWHNVWTDGVTERKMETWEQCEDEIQNIFKENLDFENIDREAREGNTLELKETERYLYFY